MNELVMLNHFYVAWCEILSSLCLVCYRRSKSSIQIQIVGKANEDKSKAFVCFGRCSKEVQLQICFGIACCHPLVETLFFGYTVCKADGQGLVC
jgi:hypothetical protein